MQRRITTDGRSSRNLAPWGSDQHDRRKENRGCQFELAVLLGEVPLARVVLLVDRTTHIEDLKTLLGSLWDQLPCVSPNRDLAQPTLQLFHVKDSGEALRPLLTRLFAAAA